MKMRCRLCLKLINRRNSISLFNAAKSETHELRNIISLNFHLEIDQNDAVSASICQECWSHLDDFLKFARYIAEKQIILRNEFLEVKSAFDDKATTRAQCDEESLIDIKDIIAENVSLLSIDKSDYLSKHNINTEGLDERAVSQAKYNTPEAVEVLVDIKEESVFDTKNERESLEEAFGCANAADSNDSDSSITTRIFSKASKAKKCNKTYKNRKTSLRTTESAKTTAPLNPIKRTTRSTKNKPAKKNVCESNDNSEADELLQTQTEKHLPDEAGKDALIAKCVSLKCEVCEAAMDTFTKLKKHYRKEHNCQGYIICCTKRFTKRFELLDHINCHLDPQYFQCRICRKSLKSRGCLSLHMKLAHSKREDLKHDCPDCGKKFVHESNLKLHRLKHQTERNFACTICNKAFVSQTRLNLHIKTMHENISPHVCDICGRAYKFKPSFDRHVAEHQGIAEDPAQCSICGEWKKNKNCLRKHLKKYHTSQADVESKCKYCDRVYTSQSALQSHIRYIHQMQKSFKCHLCEKTFKMKSNLDEHIAMHTGEKHHRCVHCSTEFRSKANMYAHVKKRHYAEWLESKVAKTSVAPKE